MKYVFLSLGLLFSNLGFAQSVCRPAVERGNHYVERQYGMYAHKVSFKIGVPKKVMDYAMDVVEDICTQLETKNMLCEEAQWETRGAIWVTGRSIIVRLQENFSDDFKGLAEAEKQRDELGRFLTYYFSDASAHEIVKALKVEKVSAGKELLYTYYRSELVQRSCR